MRKLTDEPAIWVDNLTCACLKWILLSVWVCRFIFPGMVPNDSEVLQRVSQHKDNEKNGEYSDIV